MRLAWEWWCCCKHCFYCCCCSCWLTQPEHKYIQKVIIKFKVFRLIFLPFVILVDKSHTLIHQVVEWNQVNLFEGILPETAALGQEEEDASATFRQHRWLFQKCLPLPGPPLPAGCCSSKPQQRQQLLEAEFLVGWAWHWLVWRKHFGCYLINPTHPKLQNLSRQLHTSFPQNQTRAGLFSFTVIPAA